MQTLSANDRSPQIKLDRSVFIRAGTQEYSPSLRLTCTVYTAYLNGQAEATATCREVATKNVCNDRLDFWWKWWSRCRVRCRWL